MFVIHEPINTSSTLSPATSDKVFASSGSLGQHTIGSLISLRSISITSAYSASASARINSGLANHSSIFCARRSKVRGSP